MQTATLAAISGHELLVAKLSGARAMLATVLFMCTRPPTAMMLHLVLYVG